MRRLGTSIAGLALIASAGRASAQVSGSTGVVYRSWETSGGTGREATTLSQTFVPIRAAYTFASGAELALISGGASSRIEAPGGETALDGMRSVGARLFVPVAGSRGLVQLALTPASGKSKLTGDQLRVAQSVGLPLFGFGLRQYGSGTEIGGGATAYLFRTDERRVSVGVAMTTRGKFELARGEGQYQPASEWALTAGADLGTSDDGPPLRIDLAWRSFGTDELDGREVFAEGDQLESRIDGVRRIGPRVWRGWMRATFKQENQAPGTSTLPDGYRARSGDGFAVGVSADWAWGERARPGLLLEHVRVGGSDELGRNGRVFGAGPVLGWAIDEHSSADLSATFYWGTLDGLPGGDDSNLTGFALALGLRTRRPR
jgi:hypothetical protein